MLADHIRKGKRLVPPFVAHMESLQDAEWVHTLPELLWIAVIADHHGWKRGVELSEAFVGVLHETPELEEGPFYLKLSELAMLTDDHWDHIHNELAANGVLNELREALASLLSLYPMCALRNLFAEPIHGRVVDGLPRFKSLLAELLAIRSKPATMLIATTIFLAFRTGRLKILEGVDLGDLNAVLEYPQTDESRKVAATMRAMFSMMTAFDIAPGVPSDWTRCFWNRGLELERCEAIGHYDGQNE